MAKGFWLEPVAAVNRWQLMFEQTLVSKISTLDKRFRNIQLHFRTQLPVPDYEN
jgi:hypothetical protein